MQRKLAPTLAALAALTLAAALPHAARAQTLTFDDINTGSSSSVVIPAGYQGYTWNNVYVSNGPNSTTVFGPNGYTNGVVSGTNAIFNGFGNAASVLSGSGTFGLSSGYFTGAFNDGLNVTVTGLSGGSTLFTKSFTVSATAPTLETFGWTGLTSISFASSGGTPHPGYFSSGTQFVLDNLTLTPAAATPSVPEPSTWAAFAFTALGAAALILRARKRNATV